MSDRPCEVWGLHRLYWGRMRDYVKFGHARHVCQRERPSMQEHEGQHECSCGFRYEKQPTDDR